MSVGVKMPDGTQKSFQVGTDYKHQTKVLNKIRQIAAKFASVFDGKLGHMVEVENISPVLPSLKSNYEELIKNQLPRSKWTLKEAAAFTKDLQPLIDSKVLEVTNKNSLMTINGYSNSRLRAS